MQDSSLPDNRLLSTFQKNIHSQYGEDGIIEEVLRRISCVSELDGWCVEFGAWDGVYLSNTYNLIKTKNYRAVLIEGDPVRHADLCKNIPSNEVIKVCQFVTFDGESRLDRILGRTPIPREFDLLSVDIDGCDYFIFESLVEFAPKVICIEFNPTIPNEVEFVQPRNFAVKQGSSPRALVELAKKKGYTPVAATYCNLLFVREPFAEAVTGKQRPALEDLRDDSDSRCYVFSGFDGTLLTNAPVPMPWHGLLLDQESLQVLPRFLRKFSGDYALKEKAAFAAFLALRFPQVLIKQLRKLLPKR